MDNFKCLGNCQECEALKSGKVQINCAIMMTQSRTFKMAQELKTLKDLVQQLVGNSIPMMPPMSINDSVE
jgi:hypothetical protein